MDKGKQAGRNPKGWKSGRPMDQSELSGVGRLCKRSCSLRQEFSAVVEGLDVWGR